MKSFQLIQWLAGLPLALAACSVVRPEPELPQTESPSARGPVRDLGEDAWGLVTISVANARELPSHKAEMATQILLGEAVRAWKQKGRWFQIETADGYPCWLEGGAFVRCNAAEVQRWNRGPLLIVTALEESLREAPRPDALPVSDVVLGCRLKRTGEAGDWFQVELPDGRTGFLPKHAAADLAQWQAARQPTAENIERTARQFLGRPYLWGGNTPRGLDCSGFTKLVFALNGIELKRNAGQQAQEGVDVPLDKDLSRLRKGDLVFFGHRARGGRPERVTHVGIYLGEKLFIHASQRVRINSLDTASPLCDAERARSLLRARRVLP
jgi:cell wall-associated NlpC family hydrolase